jgi:DNA repair protein RecN (Recombination protein N)
VLVELDIRDLAVAEHVRVAFAPGLNVITGETGAGKSIIVDALGLLLGGRAEASDVRTGASSARVEGIFHLEDRSLTDELQAALADAGTEPDDETLIISREIALSGRSRTTSRVNGRAVVQSTLSALGARLVDIHSQIDHVALLQPGEHIRYLDRYAGAMAARTEFAAVAQRLQQLRAGLASLQSDERERTRRLERLTFETAEIMAAELRPDEEEQLRTEQQLLANAQLLVELSDSAYAALQSGGRGSSAIDVLGRAADGLRALAELDPRLAEQAAAAEALQEQASDLGRELRAYRDNVEHNPARLAAVGERLTVLIGLERKYGATLAEVIAYGEEAARELSELEGSDEQRAALQDQERTLLDGLGARATALARLREQAAVRFTAAIEAELAELRMTGARFAVSFTRRASAGGIPVSLPLSALVTGLDEPELLSATTSVQFDASGADRVEFMVTLNPGEPLRPLARVASGGETSRLMLALKTVLGDADSVPVLVFDEIEAGLGGRSGGIVGEKLARLAEHHQVICVSHLPQIAARAQRHINVRKRVEDGRTQVEVRELAGEERVLELAAMIGAVSPATLESARELLEANTLSVANATKKSR